MRFWNGLQMMMEFLVQFEVDIPDGVPGSEIEDRERAEAAAAESLAQNGHLVRLWKASTEEGPTTVLGLYRAVSKEELDSLLFALPLYEWMRTTITTLDQHPNDPERICAIAYRPDQRISHDVKRIDKQYS
jgi:muconolactone delta-isomerase